ncbi:MAG: FlgD immunoglobulin-like domain containing protein, partial [bacterium]
TQLPCQLNIFVPFPGNVSLRVFDATGRFISTLIHDQKSSGNHLINWDGIDHRGRKVSAGSYYVVLETDGELIQQKAVLVE